MLLVFTKRNFDNPKLSLLFKSQPDTFNKRDTIKWAERPEVHSAHAVNHLSKASWHFNHLKTCFGRWSSESAENESQTWCQGMPVSVENITWSVLSYALNPQDVQGCCCSSSHKENLLRWTRCLACCGRAGRTSCAPRQAYNVPTVAVFALFCTFLIHSFSVQFVQEIS